MCLVKIGGDDAEQVVSERTGQQIPDCHEDVD